MAQNLVCAPLFAQFDRRTLEIAVILFEFALETSQQREGIAGCSGETSENLVVIKAPNLLGTRFHHGFAHRHLPVSSESYVGILPDEQHRRTANPICLFVHVSLARL